MRSGEQWRGVGRRERGERMSHWMREEVGRGEGMRTCNHFATASKMSVVEFEGSVSESGKYIPPQAHILALVAA